MILLKHPFRRIAGFFGRLLLIYGVFVLAWPGIKGAYAAFYSAGGNLIFSSLVPGGSVHFHPLVPPVGKLDTHIHYLNLQTRATGTRRATSRQPAYLQTAFLISLVLATPIAWRRRLRALASGLILVHLAILCTLFITILDDFSRPEVGLWHPSPPWNEVLKRSDWYSQGDVVMLFMVPVFIWILVSFRWSDWKRWVQADRHSEGSPKSSSQEAAQLAPSPERRRRRRTRRRTSLQRPGAAR